MTGKRINLKLLIGIPAIIVCILFGCKKRETVLLTDLDAAKESAEAVSPLEESTPLKDVPSLEEQGQPAKNSENGSVSETFFSENTEKGGGEALLVIHICGAVTSPGVYELPSGSRVYQAVEAAGGFSEEAAKDFLNQAQPLMDGVRIYIPTRKEAQDALMADTADDFITGGTEPVMAQKSTSPEAGARTVNINTASEEELCTLEGIGKTRAESIIKYRTENGSFGRIEDIMNVTGIKEAMFEKIRDKITV